MITKTCLLIPLLSALVAAPFQGLSSANPPDAQSNLINPAFRNADRLTKLYGNLSLQFEPNQGQADPQFDFVSRGAGYSLFLSAAEAVLVLNQKHRDNALDLSSNKLTMKPVGANRRSRLTGEGLLPGRVNYLIGNDAKKHHTGIRTYSQVRYSDIYPGVDMVYYGKQRQLEYDFMIAPGAKASDIILELDGATELKMDGKDIVASTGAESIRLEQPFVYQDIDGRRVEIAGRYAFRGNHNVGFEIGDYDHEQPLVIDPVLGYSSFLGGGGSEIGNDIKLDAAGNIFVTGFTTSADFPHTDTSVPKGGFDVFWR